MRSCSVVLMDRQIDINFYKYKYIYLLGDGEYVCAGSARQHALYIWEKSLGNLVKILHGTKGEMLLDVVWHPVRPIGQIFLVKTEKEHLVGTLFKTFCITLQFHRFNNILLQIKSLYCGFNRLGFSHKKIHPHSRLYFPWNIIYSLLFFSLLPPKPHLKYFKSLTLNPAEKNE